MTRPAKEPRTPPSDHRHDHVRRGVEHAAEQARVAQPVIAELRRGEEVGGEAPGHVLRRRQRGGRDRRRSARSRRGRAGRSRAAGAGRAGTAGASGRRGAASRPALRRRAPRPPGLHRRPDRVTPRRPRPAGRRRGSRTSRNTASPWSEILLPGVQGLALEALDQVAGLGPVVDHLVPDRRRPDDRPESLAAGAGVLLAEVAEPAVGRSSSRRGAAGRGRRAARRRAAGRRDRGRRVVVGGGGGRRPRGRRRRRGARRRRRGRRRGGGQRRRVARAPSDPASTSAPSRSARRRRRRRRARHR